MIGLFRKNLYEKGIRFTNNNRVKFQHIPLELEQKGNEIAKFKVKAKLFDKEVKNANIVPVENEVANFKLNKLKLTDYAKKYYEKLMKNNNLVNENLMYYTKAQRESILLKEINKEYDLYFRRLTNKIYSAILISNIIVIFSFVGALEYMSKPIEKVAIDKNTLDMDIIQSSEIKESSIKENMEVKNLIDKFNLIIENIKNISVGLYNSLKDNFNRVMNISNINYEYFNSILDNISEIKNVNLYEKILNEFNILCNNIVIISSEETYKIISNFKLIVEKYASLTSTTLGNIAKDNFEKFLKLMELPNINLQKLLASNNIYYKNLYLELLSFKGNQLLENKDISENDKKQFNENLQNITKQAENSSEIMNNELEKKIKITSDNNEGFIKKLLSYGDKVPEVINIIEKFDKIKDPKMKQLMLFNINSVLAYNNDKVKGLKEIADKIITK